MEIKAINIERADKNIYCGTLEYINNSQIGTILWTFEILSNSKVIVGFVQGTSLDWFEISQEYANYFTDNIILHITKHTNSLLLKQKV